MLLKKGRRDGLMVGALDSRSGGPGSSPDRGSALCSWARYSTVIVSLSSQVYKWVPANLLLGLTPCDGLASHPGGEGGEEILLVASCYGNQETSYQKRARWNRETGVGKQDNATRELIYVTHSCLSLTALSNKK